MIRKTIHLLANIPAISDLSKFVLGFNLYDLKNNIRICMDTAADDIILELGCGTSIFSTIVEGRYVGIDIDKTALFFAHKKRGADDTEFIISDGTMLACRNNVFDKSMCLNTMHHLSDDDTLMVLEELRRVTKERILIVDWTPFKYNVLGAWLQKHDQGKYIRTFERQKELIASVLTLDNAYTSRCAWYTFTYFISR